MGILKPQSLSHDEDENDPKTFSQNSVRAKTPTNSPKLSFFLQAYLHENPKKGDRKLLQVWYVSWRNRLPPTAWPFLQFFEASCVPGGATRVTGGHRVPARHCPRFCGLECFQNLFRAGVGGRGQKRFFPLLTLPCASLPDASDGVQSLRWLLSLGQ